jgi:hypothetical protein
MGRNAYPKSCKTPALVARSEGVFNKTATQWMSRFEWDGGAGDVAAPPMA